MNEDVKRQPKTSASFMGCSCQPFIQLKCAEHKGDTELYGVPGMGL